MVKLTERERMLRTYKRQEIDRVPMYDQAWTGTRRRWKKEGLEGWWEDYFGEWMRVTDLSAKGIAAEGGLIFKVGPVSLSAGVSTTAFKYSELEVGIGIML